MSAFTDKHKNDLQILTASTRKRLRDTQPTHADAFDKHLVDDIVGPAAMAIEKLDAVRTSGRYSQDGERKERRLGAHGFVVEHLGKVRAATVEKIESQRAAREAALLKPKPTTKDPALAMVRELQQRELRDHLRTLDPLTLATRLKQTATTDAGSLLLEAIESDPIAAAGGPAIVPADVVRDTRTAMALAADPELGELATLRDAYSFCIGAAEQVVLAASGLSKLEVVTDTTPATDNRKPVLVSTGQEVA
jgi:hypothetical protein